MSPVRSTTIDGHPALYLENDWLRVSVLPRKGADIYEIIHLPTGIDCLMKTPAGLGPPGAGPQGAFLDNYEGGWQELFPSGNAACVVEGAQVPFHGEAALRPWTAEVLRDDESPAVRLTTETELFPSALTKTLELPRAAPVLRVTWSVRNRGDRALPYSWGQHLVLGAPFLEAGCVLDAAATTISTDPEILEPATAALAPGQAEPWPYARGRKGPERVDLRKIPGPEARTHDDVFLGGLREGRCTVTNPRLNLAVSLSWDPAFYRYLALWMPYGGSDAAPLTGIYGLGVEPFTSRDNLAGAIAAGEARYLAGGGTQQTALEFRFAAPLG
jgi:galactose mutarotase-like enzyme